MRLLFAFVVGLAITAFTASASAYGNGASGYTGKQEGRSCNSCHSGGTAPQVTITGPDTLAAGATGDFTMVVSTGQTKAAGGIAASEGASLTAGTNLHDEDGELTHDSAVNAAGGKASFSFKVTAPANGTTMRLFAVGLASNGSGTGGDKATQITKDITITGGGAATPTTPTTPTTPGADPGAGTEAQSQASPGSTSTSTDATEPTKTTKKKKPAKDDDGDDDDDDDGSRRRDPFAGDATTSCSMRSGKLDPAGSGAAAGVLLGLALVRRRRR